MKRISIIVIAFFCFFQLNVLAQKPKNIIIMIGDGMGIGAVSYAVLKDTANAFVQFTTTGFSITSSESDLITDSGAGGTALATGKRTKNARIGMSTKKSQLKNIMEYAKEKGLSTGIIATSSITHATPASFTAHVDNRKKEFEIAEQLVEFGLDVAIGGGYQYFLPTVLKGDRKDSINLIARLQNKGYNYYSTIQQLKSADNSKPYFCLLEKKSLKKASDRDYSLADLTQAAIGKLKMNNKGFVLMVEGSQIDWACHYNMQKYFEAEMDDFHKAIKYALNFAKEDKNTLLIVLADHETGGLAIKSGNLDGSKQNIVFSTKDHTPALIGVFAIGPGEQYFSGIQRNDVIGRKLIEFIK